MARPPVSPAMRSRIDPESGPTWNELLSPSAPPPGSPPSVGTVCEVFPIAPRPPPVWPDALRLPSTSSKELRPPTRVELSPRASTVWTVTFARLASPIVVSYTGVMLSGSSRASAK